MGGRRVITGVTCRKEGTTSRIGVFGQRQVLRIFGGIRTPTGRRTCRGTEGVLGRERPRPKREVLRPGGTWGAEVLRTGGLRSWSDDL